MKLNKILLSLFITAPLFAQTNDLPNAGSLLRETQQAPKITPAETVPTLQSAVQIADNSNNAIQIAVTKLQLEGMTQFSMEQLYPLVQEAENRTLSLGELQQLANRITEYYQQAGYPLAQAIIPPQKIVEGVVKIQIIEGQVAATLIENQSQLKESVIEQYLAYGVPKGSVLTTAKSERALLLMKDLAGTDYIGYQLSAGENAGETVLLTRLEKASRYNGFVMLDNYGSRSTGSWRTRVGVSANSLFGRGERVSLQAMSSFKGMNYLALSSDIPLGYQGLSLSVNASHLRYKLTGEFKPLDAKGNSDTLGFTLKYPVIRSNQRNLWLNVGAEYRALQDLVKANEVDSRKQLRLLTLGATYSLEDSWLAGGYTQFTLNNTFGHLTIRSQAERERDALSAKSKGGYYKLNLSLSRTQFITQKLSLLAELNVQLANKNLDSNEQLSLGGADSIAAYRSSAVSTDDGIIAQLEARYAVAPFATVSAFYAAGRGKLRHHNYLDEKNYQTLHGGGVGLYAQYKQFSLESKLAWQGSRTNFTNDHSPKWWLKVGYAF